MFSLTYAIIIITLLCVDYTDKIRDTMKLQTFKTVHTISYNEIVHIIYNTVIHIMCHSIL